MAAAVVPPIDTVLLGHGLELRELPIQGIAPHGNQQLRSRVHGRHDTAGNIAAQVFAVIVPA